MVNFPGDIVSTLLVRPPEGDFHCDFRESDVCTDTVVSNGSAKQGGYKNDWRHKGLKDTAAI